MAYYIRQSNGAYDRPLKPHIASTKEVAKEVYADLNNRFNGVDEEPAESNIYMYDPGGVLMTDDEIVEFKLDHITVWCRAQHFYSFVLVLNELNDKPLRGQTNKYVKIHGKYWCVCVAPDEFKDLLNKISDPAIAAIINRSEKEKEKRLETINNMFVKRDNGERNER